MKNRQICISQPVDNYHFLLLTLDFEVNWLGFFSIFLAQTASDHINKQKKSYHGIILLSVWFWLLLNLYHLFLFGAKFRLMRNEKMDRDITILLYV